MKNQGIREEKEHPGAARGQEGDAEYIEKLEQSIERLEQKNALLQEALAAAEEAGRAKSRFLSSMSHDIRTPMNAIMGMTAIALSHIDEKARVQDSLQKIRTAGSHLMSLVNDVLDMSRINSGRLSLGEERFSLADLVHDVAVILRPQAAQKKQKLHIEIGRILCEDLTGDPLRLRQILVNIIGNAVKYTQVGGDIRVSFAQREGEPKEAPLSPEAAHALAAGDIVWLDFLCEDNGMGMSPEFLERIFQPFERARGTAAGKIEGTGLGMSIVKNLTDRMGGRIRVESKEGEGSRFLVQLPFPAAQPEQGRAGMFSGQTVLVGEKKKERAAQFVGCMKDSGLTAVVKAGGLELVTWLTEARYEERMPCALLLGEELTDMPVLEVASHVRQLAGDAFPIVLVSEADWTQMEYRAVRAGISAFVPCPLFPSRLMETLSRLLFCGNGQDNGPAGRETDYSGHRVLLVEDNELNQEIAMELLAMTGVQVETADNGAEAAEKFAASPEGYFELIFMDIQMPVMDGYEASRQIRRMNRADAAGVWIVAMTANAFVEDIRLSREAGMNEHVSKPVDPERLREILRKQFAGRRSERETGAVGRE